MLDVKHKNIVKKNSNEYEYKNEAVMRKDDDNKNTKLKCEYAVDNKIVNTKYDMNKNGRVVREYDKDIIEDMQDISCHDGINRTNKTNACAV